jgi:formylglycine-generating enzyme required for sulfatase activity
MLTNFIAALHENNIEPTAEELADVLWFAMQVAPHIEPLKSNPLVTSKPKKESTPVELLETPPLQDEKSLEQKSEQSEQSEKTYPIALPFGNNVDIGENVRVPATTMLPDVLLLEKALRPLIHKTKSGRREVLDEDATVKFITEYGIWLPVLKKLPEPYFDVALVVDNSASMKVWHKTINEWFAVLQRHAAFRHVRRFDLHYEQKVRLYSGLRVCQIKELIDLQGRQIILIASDCASPAWYSGEMAAFFEIWSKNNPVAIIQMLPKHLWAKCALGNTLQTYLHANAFNSPNHKLIIDEAWLENKPPHGVKMPVMTLEPESLQFWAQNVVGRADAWISGVVFDEVEEQKAFFAKISQSKPTAQQVTAEQRLQRFYAIASPMAQELVEYLAAAPLSLEVMRLVQRVMLPDSRQVHLAEIFLSGLIKRVAEHPYIEYEFHEGVRELLLESALLPDSINVLQTVSKHLERRWGHVLDFNAVLLNPEQPIEMDIKHRVFAHISAQVLKTMDRMPTIVTRLQDKLKDGTLAPEMIVLPAGEFMMGDDNGHDSEKPAHKVTIAQPFAIGKYQVTFDNYDKYCEATGAEKPSDRGWGRGKRPVINVSWEDTQKYCQWLSEQTGRHYRLPTEAEWEYACRAGSTTKWYFGDDKSQLENYAWYGENSGGKTHPVGEKKPNKFGLYDMHGNVWEWCEDSWHENYNGAPIDGSAWKKYNENKSLLRGGSWVSNANVCRSADRNRNYQDDRSSNGGVRLVCSVHA